MPPGGGHERVGEFFLRSFSPSGELRDALADQTRETRHLRGSTPSAWLMGRIDDPSGIALLEKALSDHTGEPGGLVGTVDYDGAFCFGLYERIEPIAADAPALSAAHPGWPEGEVGETPGREEYVRMVIGAKEEIAAGNIYQVNLARRFRVGWRGDPAALFAALARRSPAPFAALIRQPHRTVISASPELFLRVRAGKVLTRPIKGTRPRGLSEMEDLRLRGELISSEKERAELVMITDLLRNDLGRFCEFGSVRVEALAEVESHPHVHHLVSTISGTLRARTSAFAALASAFPGGSITGAPKLRAMQIIARLEPFERGLFTGAIGIAAFDGSADFSIAIRTAVYYPLDGGEGEVGEVFYHAGAGIVADSDPFAEFEETNAKASGFIKALQECSALRRGRG